MAQGGASGDRPSIGEANVALASLLSALKQSSASAAVAAGGPASSPAGQQAASSPAAAAAGLTPQTGGPVVAQHSSPAFPPQPHQRNLQSAPPAPSSSNAPTPSFAADTPEQQHGHGHGHGHGHPHGTNWSGQTAAELSELGTYELLLQLGAHLGVMKPPPSTTTTQAGTTGTPSAGSTLQTHAQTDGSATRTTSLAATAPTPVDSGLRDSTYRPQPTRSGRMPQQSRPHNGPGDSTDPSMSTLLFNDFFDFPSSEDEDDDPDFDPNAPADDFWGDLLARERADGDLTENEDAGWGMGGGGNAGGGSDAGAAAHASGITSDEFAREIALLTSALNDPLPDLSGRSALPPQPTRTSPRRARPAATAFIPSPAEEASEPVVAPARKKRRTTRRTLSPVLEDTPAGSSGSQRRTGQARDVLPPPGQPLASLSPRARRTQVPLPAPVVPSRYDGYGASDSFGRQPGPPSSSVASPSASPPPEADAAPRTTRKYSKRERVYTPEEAAERRRVQQAERMAVRRKEEKEKKAQEEARIKGIEQENATLRERCRWLEEKCRDLEAKLEAAYDDPRPSRSAVATSRLRARPRRRLEEEPAMSKAKPAATTGSSAKMADSVADPNTGGGGGDDDESDGGEYQVESTEESSSSSSGDDDGDAQDRAIDEDDLTPLAFPTDSPATQAGTPATHYSSSALPTGAGAAVPAGPVSLDLSSMGGPALSQLLTLVRAAANAQGISMPTADASHT